jgi:hypothetical protein
MWHAILGTLMLAGAIVTTLFTASALEKFGQSHVDLHAVPVAMVGSPVR